MNKMIFKFRITSNEVKLFHRDIQIKSKNNFFDFHDAIQSEVGFDKSQLSSFYLSDDSWTKGREISLFDLPTGDCLVMDETLLSSQLKKVGQKLIYTFDFKSDRFFMIELIEILEEDPRRLYPYCSENKGESPAQVVFKKTEDKIQKTFDEDLIDEEDEDIDPKDMLLDKDSDDDDDDDDEKDEDFGIDEDYLDGLDNFDDENKSID